MLYSDKDIQVGQKYTSPFMPGCVYLGIGTPLSFDGKIKGAANIPINKTLVLIEGPKEMIGLTIDLSNANFLRSMEKM